jgi:hypothetical protein
VADGTSCGAAGTGDVCSAGVCTACNATTACTPTNPCHTGHVGCGSSATCIDTGNSVADNTFCGVEELCTTGSCGSAGRWITRGEDNRTFTGGYVYTYATNAASILPITSSTTAFVPSTSGRTGNDLHVSGSEPVPTTNVNPVSSLGWTFTSAASAIDGTQSGTGIDIWIKSASAATIQVYIRDVETDATFGTCTTTNSSTATNVCYNYPEYDCSITTVNTWTEFQIPWSSFVRQNWGNRGAGNEVDPTQITGMEVHVPATSMSSTGPIAFDFAVDDVSFLP